MTDAEQLQQHLHQIIEQAIISKLCPPKWSSRWSGSVCGKLLLQMPLSDWLKATEQDVGESRGKYFPAKKAGKVTFWGPWFIDRPGQDEDGWERERQEQEVARERQQIETTLAEIHDNHKGD